jgi:hypothetical protein
VPEGLSASEVGKEIAEHRQHGEANDGEAAHGKGSGDWLSISEAIILSVVAVLAAWSGYSAAKWGTEGSLLLSRASASRTEANRAVGKATQIRIFDSVSFNAAYDGYVANDPRAFRLAVRRLRPDYRRAFDAWVATRPLKNPNAPPDPSYMPQYRIPEEAAGRALDARADRLFSDGKAAAATGDKYVRLTVFLATVLFLVGISGHFPVRTARYALLGIASVLLAFSVVQLLELPGPPA